MAKEDKSAERLEQLSEFVNNRKELYLQEMRDASTEVEKFIWSEMVVLLDDISKMLET